MIKCLASRQYIITEAILLHLLLIMGKDRIDTKEPTTDWVRESPLTRRSAIRSRMRLLFSPCMIPSFLVSLCLFNSHVIAHKLLWLTVFAIAIVIRSDCGKLCSLALRALNLDALQCIGIPLCVTTLPTLARW